MKHTKIILIGILLIFGSFNLQAQEQKNQLTVSYGLATVDDFANVFASLFEDIIYEAFGNDAKGGDAKSTGAFMLTYQHSFTNLLSVGPVVSYEMLSNDVNVKDEKVGEINHNLLTLAVEGRLNYVNKESFGMYFGLGAGTTFMNTSTTSSQPGTDASDPGSENHFTFQLTGVGMRIGNKLSFNGELGFGYRGLINLGLSYRF